MTNDIIRIMLDELTNDYRKSALNMVIIGKFCHGKSYAALAFAKYMEEEKWKIVSVSELMLNL